MKENLDDYKSYEPIKFSELEPILIKEQAEKVLKVAIDHKKSREDYIYYLDSTQLKEQIPQLIALMSLTAPMEMYFNGQYTMKILRWEKNFL